jgi:hypothetical protein
MLMRDASTDSGAVEGLSMVAVEVTVLSLSGIVR